MLGSGRMVVASSQMRPRRQTNGSSRLTLWFDPLCGFCHVSTLGDFGVGHLAMSSQTNERAIVHVVDDDASMRGALESLFDSVGLDTQTYAAAGDFLATSHADRPGCIVIDIRLPDMNGPEFQAQLTRMGVRMPVV